MQTHTVLYPVSNLTHTETTHWCEITN